jgi:hypothetical protein
MFGSKSRIETSRIGGDDKNFSTGLYGAEDCLSRKFSGGVYLFFLPISRALVKLDNKITATHGFIIEEPAHGR